MKHFKIFISGFKLFCVGWALLSLIGFPLVAAEITGNMKWLLLYTLGFIPFIYKIGCWELEQKNSLKKLSKQKKAK